MTATAADLDRLRIAYEAHRAGDHTTASSTYIALYERYEKDPDEANQRLVSQCIYFMALLAYEQKAMDRAITLMTSVTHRVPTYPAAHYNLGCFYNELDDLDRSQACMEAALRHDPTMVEAWSTLGGIHLSRGDAPEAMRHYARVKSLPSVNPEARYNKAIGLLTMGDYRQGWRDYEARWEMPMWLQEHAANELDPAKRWDGRPLHGKTLLVTHEQGFGDTIMMLRYDRLLRQRKGGVVIWQVQPHLQRYAMTRVAGAVTTRQEPAPDHDGWCSVMSLPFLCGTKHPTQVPPP